MSTPSSWPLPPESIRFVLPRQMVSKLATHPLSEQLYPLGIGYYQLARGHEMRREQHDDFLLIYCLEGSGRVEYGTDRKRRIIRAGDLLVLPRGTPHHYWTDQRDPWSIYWIHFDGALSQEFVEQLALRSEEHTSELQSRPHLVCRLLLEKKKKNKKRVTTQNKKHKLTNKYDKNQYNITYTYRAYSHHIYKAVIAQQSTPENRLMCRVNAY